MKKVNFKLIQSADEVKKDPAKVGKAVYDLMQKAPEYQEVGETMQMMTPKYFDGLVTAIKEGKKNAEGDFHIVVLRKKEPWSVHVLRQWFISPVLHPSAKQLRLDYPNADHDVWHFDVKTDDLKYLWTLPTAQDSMTILQTPDQYHPHLIATIQKFNAGKLL